MNVNRNLSRALVLFATFGAPVSAFAADTAQTVTVGTGTAKLGGLFQAWSYDDTTAPTTKFNFRMRRAEIKLSGNITETARWFVMADPAKNLSATGDNKILQDLGIAFAITPTLEFVLGQMKIPTTAEGYESSSELLFPERALVSRLYGDRRESGALLTWKESMFRVNAMISNGQKANIDDTNDKKDISVRAEATPTDQLKFGVFTTAGDYTYGAKSRFGVSARYTAGEILVKGEAVTARDNGVDTKGWALDGAYTFSEKFQPAARYEKISVDGAGSVSPYAVTVGMNYYELKNGAKIQAAYTMLRDMIGTSGTYVASAGTRGSLYILSFQAAL